MKIYSVVILYYPNICDLKYNISKYIDYVDILFVWDNTPQKDVDYNVVELLSNDKVVYRTSFENKGVSYALNKAIEFSTNNNADLLLMMDQDSIWDDGHFFKYRQYLIQYLEKKEYILFSPFVKNVFTPSHLINIPIVSPWEADLVITSGSVLRLSSIKNVGLFWEDLFIDLVDVEFCLRIKKYGYKILTFNDCILNQPFGNMKYCSWGKFYITNYSAFRIYHIVRNGIIVEKLYSKNLFSRFITTIKIVIKIILFEKNKKKKMKAYLYGVLDGLFNNLSERKF